jgi:hypothetical protein
MARGRRIDLAKLIECLANDRELALHARAQKVVGKVIGKSLALGETNNLFGGPPHIPQ